MDTNTFYFLNVFEEGLSILAVKAKEMIQQIDNIVEIFQDNNEIMYGLSPRKASLLAKQKKKSIFSPKSSHENSPITPKLYERIKTPIRCNTDTSYKARRCLPLDDLEEKEHHSAILEDSTPTGHQKQIVKPAVKTILNLTIDKTHTRDQVSTTSSQESSAEITNLTRDKKECGNLAKVLGSLDATNQESPASSGVSLMKASLATTEKELHTPTTQVDKIKQGNQASPRSAEIARMTSRLRVDDKKPRNLIRKDQMAGSSATNKDSPKPEENDGESENPDLINKYFITEEIKISKPSLIGGETPSPVKRTKKCSIPTSDTRRFASLAKKDIVEEKPPEEIQVTIGCMQGDKLNISANGTIKESARDDRKRKSLSSCRNGRRFLKSIPTVIKLAGDAICIEVLDQQYDATPNTSRSKSADYRRDSTKDPSIESPVADESKTSTSPKIPKIHLRPPKRAMFTSSSCNLSETSSSGCADDVFASKYQSYKPSKVATASRNLSCVFESSLADIKDYSESLEFNTIFLSELKSTKKSFVSFLKFQRDINFINCYVHNGLHLILTLDVSGKYSAMDFKEIVRDTIVLAQKLVKELQSLETNVDDDIDHWYKSFQQSEPLKVRYEQLYKDEGKSKVSLTDLQEYEFKLETIQEEMDGMVTQGDTRRVIFSGFAPDVERFIKMLVKCFIIVGILHSR